MGPCSRSRSKIFFASLRSISRYESGLGNHRCRNFTPAGHGTGGGRVTCTLPEPLTTSFCSAMPITEPVMLPVALPEKESWSEAIVPLTAPCPPLNFR